MHLGGWDTKNGTNCKAPYHTHKYVCLERQSNIGVCPIFCGRMFVRYIVYRKYVIFTKYKKKL